MICTHDHKGREKPAEAPVDMIECDCGQNKRCEICGYEIRKIPCDCRGHMKPKMDKRMHSEPL